MTDIEERLDAIESRIANAWVPPISGRGHPRLPYP